ncbi:MAG: NfeD family protein, partial [Clostridia bacterium]|nr:NfeD family protein [Clostridia bacterium]
VNPYYYTNANGHTIVYYHCITSYMSEEPSEVECLNTAAIEQVVAIESLENIREYEISGVQTVMGECNGRSYLCWTLTPTDSCVIEFTTGEIAEEDILPRSIGRVKVGGISWAAYIRNDSLPVKKGEFVKIIAIDGVKLEVEKIETKAEVLSNEYICDK